MEDFSQWRHRNAIILHSLQCKRVNLITEAPPQTKGVKVCPQSLVSELDSTLPSAWWETLGHRWPSQAIVARILAHLTRREGHPRLGSSQACRQASQATKCRCWSHEACLRPPQVQKQRNFHHELSRWPFDGAQEQRSCSSLQSERPCRHMRQWRPTSWHSFAWIQCLRRFDGARFHARALILLCSRLQQWCFKQSFYRSHEGNFKP